MIDIDLRFGDLEEIGPIEDLQEVRLEEEDPTRVVKVGINLETTTNTTGKYPFGNTKKVLL